MRVPGIPYIQGRNYQTNPAGRHYGIAVHCTASTATARQEAAYAQKRTDGIGSHLYSDAIEIIQSVDTIYKVNHAGSANGNQYGVCLEQTGLTNWSRQQWLDNLDWHAQAGALAAIIEHDLPGFAVRRATVAEMRANPKVMAFYGHDDMRQAWGGTTHTDPGPNYPWDHLLSTVNAALNPAPIREEDGMRILHQLDGEGNGVEETYFLAGAGFDLVKGLPIALTIPPPYTGEGPLADYRAGGYPEQSVYYVNPAHYSIDPAPVAGGDGSLPDHRHEVRGETGGVVPE